MPIASPRTCSILVERDADVAALDDLLTAAAAGHGRLVLLTGEAGAGKSRLLREVVAHASSRGFQQLAGACAERDRDFPFAPIVDALRQQRMTAPSTTAVPASGHALLSELLPEACDGSAPASGAAALPPEQAKRRLFEAIGACFTRMGAHQPLLVTLEDLHWADPTSLELLEILPRRLATARVLIVGATRLDEPNPELHHLMTALRRARAVVELSVDPLSEAGVGRMLQALLATSPSPSLVAAVHARTGGNPFFVEELLPQTPNRVEWLLGEAAVPATVQDTLFRRLGDLDASARDVIEVAAVIGQRFSFELLLEAANRSHEELVAALRTLVDRSILVEEGPTGRGSFAFRHALTRDALHGRLLAPQRRALHRVVAEALERAYTPDHLTAAGAGRLGYHFHEAGIWDKALTYAAGAALAAERLHATVEALTHLRRALTAAQALDDDRMADLHHRCGLALARLGTFDEARAHLEASLEVARQRGLGALEQAVLYDLAGLYASRDYPAARRLAEKALALARSTGDRHREGMALNRLGNVLTNLLQFEKGRALHEDALAIFTAEGDQWGSADSLDLIGMARYLAGDVSEARDVFGRAAELFADLGDTERVASALTSRGIYIAVVDGPCATSESPDVFQADALSGLRLSREIAWRSGEAYALVALACAALGAGRLGEAQRYADEALAIAEDIDHPQWAVIALLTLGILEVELGIIDGAKQRFERALDLAQAAGAAQWIERLQAWIGFCQVRRGESDVPLLTDLVDPDSPPTVRPRSVGQRRALVALAEHDLARNRPHQALAGVDRHLTGAAGPRPAGALLLRGDVLAALGQTGEADAAYQEARRTASTVGPRFVLWRVAAARARLWRDRDLALVAEETARTRTEIETLAATVTDPARREMFLAMPEVQSLLKSSDRPRTDTSDTLGQLTRREREVATHVAQGMSNREIASALFIAEKTVEMHISSCLSKLGFASRTQLATWVATQGLYPASQTQG